MSAGKYNSPQIGGSSLHIYIYIYRIMPSSIQHTLYVRTPLFIRYTLGRKHKKIEKPFRAVYVHTNDRELLLIKY